MDRYKARLVAKGFKHSHGIDYDDRYSPIVKPTTIRVILSLAVTQGWHMRQLDIDNAFIDSLKKRCICLDTLTLVIHTMSANLRNFLYGLKQAPIAWFARLSSKLHTLGFVASKADVSLFSFKDKAVIIYMLVYVDDIIVVSSHAHAADRLLAQLRCDFPVKDLGQLGYFLGIEVQHVKDGLILFQHIYSVFVEVH
jgi:hypothetical protein